MEVIHDWGNAECVAILSRIRRAAAPGATVLVVENVLPDEGIDPRGQTLDVIMLAVTGGRERTPSQLSELFNRAGFGDGTVSETAGPLRIVEPTAVGSRRPCYCFRVVATLARGPSADAQSVGFPWWRHSPRPRNPAAES